MGYERRNLCIYYNLKSYQKLYFYIFLPFDLLKMEDFLRKLAMNISYALAISSQCTYYT